MSNMAPSREKLIGTARAQIESYKTWSLDAIMEHRSPDCIQHNLPASRKHESRNNQQYREFFTQALSLYTNFSASVADEETFVDVEKRKVYMHVRSRADTPIGTYANEYAFVMKMTEEGDKVQEIWEFVDTAYTADFASRREAEQLLQKTTQ